MVTTTAKPIPVPNEDNQPYWDGAREHKLILPHCTACGWYFPQPQVVCFNCQNDQLEWKQVSGKGTIFSYTVVYQTVTPGFSEELPYVIVLVAIDEQPQCVITTNLVGGYDADKLDLNLPVVVEFEERGEVTLPQFRLA